MNARLPAADPNANAAVLASAGTGKTWLLVTRMIRLLLTGTRPEGILAVTFTRKAAAEMLQRLNQRLRAFAQLDDDALVGQLQAMDAPTDTDHLQRARTLYERLLFAERPLRATTFHAFCQEVLQRFPLEANIPPGFELLETTAALEQQAWDALRTEATRAPDSPLANALEVLLDRCTSLYNTEIALHSFLQHRSDWWAYTESWEDPVAEAGAQLAEALAVQPGSDPLRDLPRQLQTQLRECAELLQRHRTAGNTEAAQRIQTWLNRADHDQKAYNELRLAFFTQKNEPRKRKPSGAQRKSLGEVGEQRLLDLHEALRACIEQTDETLARLHTLELNLAWYRAGARLVAHFQRLKREQRLLDFTDLEWRTYRLLNRSDNAHWVQYKLDQRIEHLLVDEFQDTNPTQWQLLAPLLEELAAGTQERSRSVFIVGDEKQSIYRFRRAEPQLLDNAAQWLAGHMAARTETLEKSWRSAPAVITLVNAVFEGPLASRMPGFRHHQTHRAELWGAVEVLALQPAEQTAEAQDEPAALRNPLQQPREVDEDLRHYREGQQVAARIRELVRQRTPVQVDGVTRPLRYDDIYVLMRKRTHVGAMEQALREAGIPYVGAGRGTLLESLEVADMEALLNVLVSPYDNLALAQVLRAPIFSCSDIDLLRLAAEAQRGIWRAALARIATAPDSPATLTRAHALLGRWEALAGRIPVHDLLDRIYHEGNVPARYEAAYPGALRPRVRANLARFISLALEVDSGRYPSLPRFIHRLRQLRRHALEAPDEPPSESAESRVRLMTVHAAKGLEAPVVFVVDSATASRARRPYTALVHWPPGAARPARFLVTTPTRMRDPVTQALLEREQDAELREDGNLLYVALTRARQYLFISASAPRSGEELGWYGCIRDGLASLATPQDDGTLRLEMGTPQPCDPASPPATDSAARPDPRLRTPMTLDNESHHTLPSAASEPHAPATADEDGRPRGIAIHRLLELLSHGTAPIDALRSTAALLQLPPDGPQLQAWLAEARAVTEDPALAHWFDPAAFQEAFNEIPLQFEQRGRTVSGVIDRLLLRGDEVWIVDYKSHRIADRAAAQALAAGFAPQLQLYAEGARRLWPGRTVRAFLLFTQLRQLHEVALE